MVVIRSSRSLCGSDYVLREAMWEWLGPPGGYVGMIRSSGRLFRSDYVLQEAMWG